MADGWGCPLSVSPRGTRRRRNSPAVLRELSVLLVPALRMWGGRAPGCTPGGTWRKGQCSWKVLYYSACSFQHLCRRRPQTFLPASLFLLHPLDLDSEVPSQRAAHLTEWPALACPGSPSALPLLPRRWAAGACAPPAAPLPPAGDTSPAGCAPGNPARPLTPGSGAHCLPPGKKVFSFGNSTEQSRMLLKLKLFPSGHPAVRVTVLLFETQ